MRPLLLDIHEYMIFITALLVGVIVMLGIVADRVR
jgi:hypothetical protein